jgi:CubicO group peptidase (beta-lactamase class C family)
MVVHVMDTRLDRVRKHFLLAGVYLAGFISMPGADAQEIGPPFIWPRAQAEEVRIAPSMPEALDVALTRNTRLLSFGLVRDGKLVIEHYQNGTASESYVNVASVTKSVLAILVGIALDRHVFKSVDQPLTDFFPELDNSNVDPKSRLLTLKHLLSMSAGWQGSPTDIPPARAMDALKRKVELTPGETFQYDNASSHLLGIALSRASGMSLEAFAEMCLFRPLGITQYIWGKDDDGHTQGWHMLHLRLLDMLKIGQLVLDLGQWQGHRVVSEFWIHEMLAQRNSGGPYSNIPYGYQWYVHHTPDRQYQAVMAMGYGGQFIYLVPALRLAIAITHTRDQRSADMAFMRSVVLPAIQP